MPSPGEIMRASAARAGGTYDALPAVNFVEASTVMIHHTGIGVADVARSDNPSFNSMGLSDSQ